MSIVLVRIDDRLIHGQVTVGWESFLNPDRIVLISDEIANNEWEKELYKSCVPFNIAVSIFTIEEAAESLLKKIFNEDRIILLAESPGIYADLVKQGVQFQQINIGGMRHSEDKSKILPYIFLSEKDIEDFRFLDKNNIELICQDLPQAKKENLADLLPR